MIFFEKSCYSFDSSLTKKEKEAGARGGSEVQRNVANRGETSLQRLFRNFYESPGGIAAVPFNHSFPLHSRTRADSRG